MKGFNWYIKCVDGAYTPNEKLFKSIFDCMDDIKSSSCYNQNQTNFFIGIDFCSDDDGYVQVLKQIVVPTEFFYNND